MNYMNYLTENDEEYYKRHFSEYVREGIGPDDVSVTLYVAPFLICHSHNSYNYISTAILIFFALSRLRLCTKLLIK